MPPENENQTGLPAEQSYGSTDPYANMQGYDVGTNTIGDASNAQAENGTNKTTTDWNANDTAENSDVVYGSEWQGTNDTAVDEGTDNMETTVIQGTESNSGSILETCFLGLNTVLLVLILLLQIYIIFRFFHKQGKKKPKYVAGVGGSTKGAKEEEPKPAPPKEPPTPKKEYKRQDPPSPKTEPEPPRETCSPVSQEREQKEELYDFSLRVGAVGKTFEKRALGEGDYTVWSDKTVTVERASDLIPIAKFKLKGYEDFFDLKDSNGQNVHPDDYSKIKILHTDPGFPAIIGYEGKNLVVLRKGILIVRPKR